jgi:hypothetical protein
MDILNMVANWYGTMSNVTDKDLSDQHPQFGQHDPYLAQSQEMGFEDIMNEVEAGHRWASYAGRRGMYTRLENTAGASIPDAIYMAQGYMGWFEVKKLYNDAYIYGPPFQMAWAVRASHHIHDWQHHYVVYGGDTFKIYTVKQIRSCENTVRGNKVRYDIRYLIPVFQVSDDEEFGKFFEYLMKEAFG